jgi:uncharacterized membrane protein
VQECLDCPVSTIFTIASYVALKLLWADTRVSCFMFARVLFLVRAFCPFLGVEGAYNMCFIMIYAMVVILCQIYEFMAIFKLQCGISYICFISRHE